MKVDELETILNKVGGFTPAELQQTKTPFSTEPVTKPTTEASKEKDKKKMPPKSKEGTSQINQKPQTIDHKDKKRTRKTKQDILQEMATTFHGPVMGNKYTSTRNRKVLLRFIKIVYPKMKNFQIIDFLLLQALEQNKHLLPDNYMDSVLQEDELV